MVLSAPRRVGRCATGPGPFAMEVVAGRVEEPIRDRHHPVMAAFAVHDGHPSVADPQILERSPRTSHRPGRPAPSPGPSPGPGCVRNAPTSRSASPGDKIFGNVRGTRTNGTVRERFDPPSRHVNKPRGTGLTAPAYHPAPPGTHTGPTPTTTAGRSSGARQPRLAIRHPHHRAVTSLPREEVEHVHRGDLDRVFRHHGEEGLQVKRHRPGRVRLARPATNTRYRSASGSPSR